MTLLSVFFHVVAVPVPSGCFSCHTGAILVAGRPKGASSFMLRLDDEVIFRGADGAHVE
jgi:hypothetical protein